MFNQTHPSSQPRSRRQHGKDADTSSTNPGSGAAQNPFQDTMVLDPRTATVALLVSGTRARFSPVSRNVSAIEIYVEGGSDLTQFERRGFFQYQPSYFNYEVYLYV
jgi:hypothetical protein